MKKLYPGLILLSLLIPLWTIDAQADLLPFTTVNGNIGAGETQDWLFSAVDGEVVSLIVEGIGNIDTSLTILSETGAVLVQNDDYDYPNNLNPAIQALTIPFTGTYTARISSINNTSGPYILTRLRGFAREERINGFTEREIWTSNQSDLQIEQSLAQINLELQGNNIEGITVYEGMSRLEDFYAQVDVTINNARPGWVTSMTIRQQNSETYYLFSIDNRGLHRFLLRNRGQETILRDWISHPAITPGETSFTIGVLANGSGFDLFYNGSLLGQIVDTTLDSGIVGIGIETRPGLDSVTNVTYDNLMITLPLSSSEDSNVVTDQIILGAATDIVQRLERRREIPAGGSLALNVPESSIQFTDPGISLLPLGRGTTYTNFVLFTEVNIQATESTPVGCGIYFRAASDDVYTIAYVDKAGAYGLAERQQGEFLPGIFVEDDRLTRGEHQLLIIANNEMLRYYIDGRFVGTLESASINGGIGNAVVNFEQNVTVCTFENTWLWSWQ